MNVLSDPKALLRDAKRRIVMVLLSIGVGVAAGYGVAAVTPPTYEATGSVLLTGGAARDVFTGQFIDTSIARNLAPTIARLAESREVALAAAAKAQVPAHLVVDRISTEFEQGVQIILVKARAPTAAQAATIANAATHVLIEHVERRRIDGTGSVGAQPLDQAATPTRPILPKPWLNIALGALLGLLAGIGLARARDLLDDKIDNIDELRGVAGVPVLASIPFERRVSSSPIADRPYTPWSEAFVQLRTNLEFLKVDSHPRVVAITSALSDEGKSITACNLAIAVARAGRRVLLIEADLWRPACSRYLGVRSTTGLTTVLTGNVEASRAIVRWGEQGLMYLPAGPRVPNASELLASRTYQEFLRQMRDQYDLVILDLPALLPTADAAVLAGRAQGTILLARHRHTRAKQIRRAVDALAKVNARLIGCVFNMTPRQEAYGYDLEATRLPRPRPGGQPEPEPNHHQ